MTSPNRTPARRSKPKKRRSPRFFPTAALLVAALCVCIRIMESHTDKPQTDPYGLVEPVSSAVLLPSPDTALTKPFGDGAKGMIEAFAKQNGLSVSAYPQELVELLDRNKDTTDFVLHYPLKKNNVYTIDLSAVVPCSSVPRLYQWDERWGYTTYSGELMGLSGCGPTCLSMAAIYLRQDAKYDPRYVADFSTENGYAVSGSGSAWDLMTVGARGLGLTSEALPLSEEQMKKALESGKLVICIMGPGVFTTGGHFILFVGYEDGKFIVNDPNSPTRSEKRWGFDEFGDQIRNLWAIGR